MAGITKKCVERYCELANKTTQQLYKVSTPCIDDHHLKEEEITCWSLGTVMGKSTKLEISVHRKRGLFLPVYGGGHQNGWKEAEDGSHVEEMDEEC